MEDVIKKYPILKNLSYSEEHIIKKYPILKNLSYSEEHIIIKKSDVENLGKKLMKEVYEFLHDEYILSFEEMKKEKDKREKYLINFYFKKDKKKVKYFPSNFKKDEIEDEIKDEIKEKYLEIIKNKIEDESLDIDLIFKVLDIIELKFEIYEDLYCKNKAFLYIYSVFYYYYKYLEY